MKPRPYGLPFGYLPSGTVPTGDSILPVSDSQMKNTRNDEGEILEKAVSIDRYVHAGATRTSRLYRSRT